MCGDVITGTLCGISMCGDVITGTLCGYMHLTSVTSVRFHYTLYYCSMSGTANQAALRDLHEP